LLALSQAAAAQARTAASPPGTWLVGQASVTDGDSLEFRGARIRLHGVDAPESRQMCGPPDQLWPCGRRAANALSDWIGGRTVSCLVRRTDRFGRLIATCSVSGADMQDWLVRNGWAMAYRRFSMDYVAAEQAARQARAGIWSGEFVPPWEWRRQQQRSVALVL
jgi:endonuclease YncB( thermonuclease family)